MITKMTIKQRAETVTKRAKRPTYTTLLWHEVSSMTAYVQKSLPQQMQRGLFWVAVMKMMRTK
jgi:hypothetical protein